MRKKILARSLRSLTYTYIFSLLEFSRYYTVVYTISRITIINKKETALVARMYADVTSIWDLKNKYVSKAHSYMNENLFSSSSVRTFRCIAPTKKAGYALLHEQKKIPKSKHDSLSWFGVISGRFHVYFADKNYHSGTVHSFAITDKIREFLV